MIIRPRAQTRDLASSGQAPAVTVTSLAALKALSSRPASVVTQYRTTAGDGGGGMWVWRSGDQSANITADPQSGVWAAPLSATSGASGAWQRQYTGDLNAKWFGAVGDGVTDDTTALRAGHDYAADNGGTLFIPAGTYEVDYINVKSGTSVRGAGIDKTTLKQDYVGRAIFSDYTDTIKTNVFLSGMTLDAADDSGINIAWVHGITIRDIKIENPPAWCILIGTTDARALDGVIASRDILIENCEFASGTTFEGVCIWNSENVVVSNCYFKGQSTSVGIGVGIYQFVYGMTVENCFFEDIEKGSYYSVTCDQITYTSCRFTNCTAFGIQGANESDWGLHGRTDSRGLTVEDCTFTGCTIGLQVGAVTGGYISGCNFVENIENALVISGGNTLLGGTIAACRNLMVEGCTFRNNNTVNTLWALHPGVLFNAIGGNLRAFFFGCTWIDDQGTPTQKNAVAFDGAFTWSNIYFIGCSMPAYSGGNTVTNTGSATLSGIRLISCTDIGGLATGAYADIDANGNYATGSGSLATNATNGFLYIRACAGKPTGTPTTKTGMVPLAVDSTNNKLYFYSGGAWRDAGP